VAGPELAGGGAGAVVAGVSTTGGEAVLALGAAALPRPKPHPAQAAVIATAIAADRRAAGHARFGDLDVTRAMVRRTRHPGPRFPEVVAPGARGGLFSQAHW
jgi:hypothetical protein